METTPPTETSSPPAGKWYHNRPLQVVVGIALVLAVLVVVFHTQVSSYFHQVKNSGGAVVPGQVSTLSSAPNYAETLKKYNLSLTGPEQQYLEKNKFVLVGAERTNLDIGSPRYYDEMLAYFDQLGGNRDPYHRTQADTVLVTPDIALHAYHKFFDIALKDLEKRQLSGYLAEFTQGMQENARVQVTKESGATVAHAQRILAQLTVARILQENQAPAKPDYFSTPDQETEYAAQDKLDNYDSAKKLLAKYSEGLSPQYVADADTELKRIYAATDRASSPLFGLYNPAVSTDYTQFTPRSHYTETSGLRAYFRTMMYLGRSAYFFKNTDGITDAKIVSSLFEVKSTSGVKPIDSWKKITAVTDFFAGQNDDISYTEFTDWLAKVDGENPEALTQNLWQLRTPKILSDAIVSPAVFDKTKNDLLKDTLSFRVFGQKFTFDAWLLNELTAGQEKTDVRLPSMPTALYIPASFGDKTALGYLEKFLQKDAGFSKDEVTAFTGKLQSRSVAIASVPEDQWNASLGSAWLKLLSTLTGSYDDKFPAYMRGPNFGTKQVESFLGSYTELKHDTLLYAKQSYAELGGGGGDEDIPIPPVVRGYVEPNVPFWKRLGALVTLTDKLFKDNGLGESQVTERLAEFGRDVAFFQLLAEKEIAGQPVTDEEYEQLRTMQLSFIAAPLESVDLYDSKLKRSGLVADIHTDTVTSKILYEGNGRPLLMLTIVGEGSSTRLSVGVAFNHYEFTGPLGGKRITDEDWKNQVYENPNDSTDKPFYYDSLTAK